MMQNTTGLPGLRRALLLTLGPLAVEVAGRAAALSQAWLGVTPPLAVEPLDGAAVAATDSAPCVERLADACDRLAAGELAAALAGTRWPLTLDNEIAVWLLVDVASAEADAWPPALLHDLQEAVWRRLRVHLTPAALLLAAPAHQEAVHAWAGRLATAGVERMALAGPVDAAHLRWSPEAWQARAATALAALLWSEARLSALQVEAGSDHAWAVAAAAWPSPEATIRRQATLHNAALTIRRLLEAPRPEADAVAETPPWEVPGLAITPERHRLALEAALSPEPAAVSWSGWRVSDLWSRLAGLPDELAGLARTHTAAAHDAQHAERGAWLAEHMARWEEALQALRTERLAPSSGWPALGRYRLELAGLAAQLQAACVTIEDWLEAAGQQFAAAEVAVQRTRQALSDTCSRFPPATRHGLLTALLQPWRWPGWLWKYLVTLPNQGQQYLNAIGRQGRARWQEANVHALRQAYLAMAQAVQERQREAAAWADALAAAQTTVADELARPVALPEPWQPTRPAELAAACLPADGPSLLSLPSPGAPDNDAEVGPDSRLGADAPDALSPGWPTADAVLAGLLAWSAASLSRLDDWTAADYLAAAGADGMLAPWLTRWREQARPLWPADNAGAATGCWLLCPARRQADAGPTTPAEAQLQALLAPQPATEGDGHALPRLAALTADAVLLLQILDVNLKEAV